MIQFDEFLFSDGLKPPTRKCGDANLMTSWWIHVLFEVVYFLWMSCLLNLFAPAILWLVLLLCFFLVLYLPCGVGTGKLIFNGIGKLTCITGCNIHQEKDACSQPWWEIITSLYTVFGRSTTVGGFSSAFEDFHVDFHLLGFNHQLCDLLFSPPARLSCFLWIGF